MREFKAEVLILIPCETEPYRVKGRSLTIVNCDICEDLCWMSDSGMEKFNAMQASGKDMDKVCMNCFKASGEKIESYVVLPGQEQEMLESLGPENAKLVHEGFIKYLNEHLKGEKDDGDDEGNSGGNPDVVP